VRAARIAALRAQVARGEYHPDPREVAKKILEHGL
jgi:anti-sigma28 factor (negative regulator of flagellin synthesis)